MAKEKITYGQLCSNMYNYNLQHPEREDEADLIGVIVYKASNWKAPYTEQERSYEVANCNRAFQPNKIANSIFGNCLDGQDIGVRLDWYKWEVDYCYMR